MYWCSTATPPHKHILHHSIHNCPPLPTHKLNCPLAGAVPPSTVLPHTMSAAFTNWLLLLLLPASELARLLPPPHVVRKETWYVMRGAGRRLGGWLEACFFGVSGLLVLSLSLFRMGVTKEVVKVVVTTY